MFAVMSIMMKNYNKTSWTVLLICVALAVGIWVGTKMSPYYLPVHGQDGKRNFALRKLNYAMDLVEKQYVDTIQYDTLVDKTLTAMLYALDPHSIYLSREELDKEDEQLRGHIDGIGILLNMQSDTVRVLQVLPGSPASHVDLRPGDCILKVDGKAVAHQNMGIQKIIDMIKGPSHTRVQLVVKRVGQEGQRKVTIRRGSITTPSVGYAGMLTDTVGYVSLTSFTQTSASEFSAALQQLKGKGMKHLVLDLRGNGGGLMSAAEGVADELLPGNELIVYMQGAHQPRVENRSTPGGLFCHGGVTVLVNENSASASEIVAGAIQDNDRGLVVGRRSFGKGLVQNQFPLPDRSALQLTTARYYTPSGRCIQRPYDKGNDAYLMDYIMRVYDVEGEEDSAAGDTTRYYTQKGHVVYGGGGIKPDYPLPAVTDKAFIYYNQLQASNLYTNVALNYVARNWTMLKSRYPTQDLFVKDYETPAALLEQLLHAGDTAGVRRDPQCIAKYGGDMRQQLKSVVGLCLYGDEVRYRIMLQRDSELQRALKFIEGGSLLPQSNKAKTHVQHKHKAAAHVQKALSNKRKTNKI